MTRITYDRYRTCPRQGRDSLVLKSPKGEKVVPPGKWWINRNTPVGEDADYWERMPYGGKRWINDKIVAFIEP